MQKVTYLLVVFIIGAATAYGQSIDQLITQLQSPDSNVRINSFYQLSHVGFATSDQLRIAAIGLLKTENANNNLTPSTIPNNGEAYGEYYGDVIETVVGLNDPRSIPALVGAINTGNMAMNAIASFGTSALDQVIQQLSNANPTMRGSAALTIGKMIDANLVGDSNSRSKIQSALNIASIDSDYYVGLSATRSLLKLLGITATGLPVRVAVDVKPSAFPNAINPSDHGVIPVAILSTPTFDARTIDPTSLRFGPGQAVAASGAHVEDVNGDGLPDIVLQFSIPASQIACGDTASFLIGKTTSGQMIVGADSVLTVGCK